MQSCAGVLEAHGTRVRTRSTLRPGSSVRADAPISRRPPATTLSPGPVPPGSDPVIVTNPLAYVQVLGSTKPSLNSPSSHGGPSVSVYPVSVPLSDAVPSAASV